MNKRFVDFYMDVTKRTSEMSRAVRLQVGSIIVKEDKIISLGYNGTPAGWDNVCEYKDYDLSRDFNGNRFPGSKDFYPYEDERGYYTLKTKPEVLHAEMNALMKLARSNESGLGASMFITHSPCIECAKGIYQAGIKEVYYKDNYRDTAGIEFLQKCGVKIVQV